jgi:hypothetical protein
MPAHPRIAYYMRQAGLKFAADRSHDRKRAMRKALGIAPGGGRPGYADDVQRFAADTVSRLMAEGKSEKAAVLEAAELTRDYFAMRGTVSVRTIRSAVHSQRLHPRTIREQGQGDAPPLSDFIDPA